jgi:RNA polymerase sigma-70 factor (ECF subfamily)
VRAEYCTPEELVNCVRGIIDNTPGSVEDLFDALGKGMRFHFLRTLGNVAEAEDGVHDCFMVVLQAIQSGTLREPAAVAGFAVTVTRRYAYKIIEARIRDRARMVSSDTAMIPVGPRQEHDHYNSEQVEILRAALAALPEFDREILRRFYLLEQSEEEIREALNLTGTQFRLRKSRAKAKLLEEARRLSRPLAIGKRPVALLALSATA